MDTNAHEFSADIQTAQLSDFCLIHDLGFLNVSVFLSQFHEDYQNAVAQLRS